MTTTEAPPEPSAPAIRSSRTKRWAARLVLAGVTALLTLFAAELVLRVLSPGYSPLFLDIYALNDSGVLTLRPGIARRHVTAEWDVHVTINRDGLRDREAPVSDGGGRVVVIGDSLAFGWGVELEESFSFVAEERLKGHGVRVIKAGVPGTGPNDQLRWLQARGETHEPDVVVASLFVGNDFSDVQFGGVPAQFTVRDGLMVKRPLDDESVSWLYEAKEKLKRSSLLAQYAAQLLWTWEREHVAIHERTNPGLSAGDRWLWEFFQIHLKDAPQETQRSFEGTCAVLDGIDAWSRQRGAAMLLLVIPRSFQVYPWELEQWTASFQLSDEKLDLDRPQRVLTDWAQRRGVAILDLLPLLREHAARHPEDRAYFYPNAHMNATGHRLTGEWLAEGLAPMLTAARHADRRPTP